VVRKHEIGCDCGTHGKELLVGLWYASLKEKCGLEFFFGTSGREMLDESDRNGSGGCGVGKRSVAGSVSTNNLRFP
jgi:hypothetical protein